MKSFIQLTEAYNIIPSSEGEIDKLSHLSDDKKKDLKDLYNELVDGSSMNDPIALSAGKNKNIVKVARAVADDFNLPALAKKYGFTVHIGDGSRGGRGEKSKGFAFEHQIVKDLNLYVQEGITADFKFPDMMRKMHVMFLKDAEKIDVTLDGGANTKRPLVFGDIDAVIGGRELQIGSKVTDVTATVDGKPHYISAKFGGTVTFFNSGVKTIFKDKEFEEGKITNREGVKLLNMLGIDNDRFVQTFTKYDAKAAKAARGKAQKDTVDVTSKANRKALQRLLITGIGYGYFMAHRKGKKVEFYEMTRRRMMQSAKIQSIKVKYPKNGEAKRIDIEVVTPLYIFNFNIRNKQGGLYPTHLMCDYKPNNA